MNELKQTIASCVTVLCEAFGRVPSEATYHAYEIGLRDLSPADIRQATEVAISQSKFMPPPATLRELVATSGQGLDARAMQAWDAVEKAVVAYGFMKTVAFDDPLINAAINVTGRWERYCSASIEEFDKWLRKDFVAAYMAFIKSPPPAELCRACLGEAARTNGFHHDHDRVVSVETGLAIGPVQERLSASRDSLTRRPDSIPQVEFQKV